MLFDSRKEMDQATTQKMMTLVFELLCQSDLMLAKVLRKKVIEKCESKRASPDQFSSMTFTSSITLKSRYVSHMESSMSPTWNQVGQFSSYPSSVSLWSLSKYVQDHVSM